MKGPRFRVAQSLEAAFNVGDSVFGDLQYARAEFRLARGTVGLCLVDQSEVGAEESSSEKGVGKKEGGRQEDNRQGGECS